MNDHIFKTYERTVPERKKVAKITEENIGQIAAIVKGQVDYTGDTPVLVVDSSNYSKVWRIKVGSEVSLLGNLLVNQNGFNLNGDWHEVKEEVSDAYKLVVNGHDWDYSLVVEDVKNWRDKVLREEPDATVEIVAISREELLDWKAL